MLGRFDFVALSAGQATDCSDEDSDRQPPGQGKLNSGPMAALFGGPPDLRFVICFFLFLSYKCIL